MRKIAIFAVIIMLLMAQEALCLRPMATNNAQALPLTVDIDFNALERKARGLLHVDELDIYLFYLSRTQQRLKECISFFNDHFVKEAGIKELASRLYYIDILRGDLSKLLIFRQESSMLSDFRKALEPFETKLYRIQSRHAKEDGEVIAKYRTKWWQPSWIKCRNIKAMERELRALQFSQARIEERAAIEQQVVEVSRPFIEQIRRMFELTGSILHDRLEKILIRKGLRSNPYAIRSILIVEDDMSERNQLKTDLLKWNNDNLEIETANNGAEALEIIKARGKDKEFDLILSDVNMPIMDGYRFYKELRSLGISSLFVFVSGTVNSLFTPDGFPVGNINKEDLSDDSFYLLDLLQWEKIRRAQDVPMLSRLTGEVALFDTAA